MSLARLVRLGRVRRFVRDGAASIIATVVSPFLILDRVLFGRRRQVTLEPA